MAGLNPDLSPSDVEITPEQEGDTPEYAQNGDLLKIEHDDGSITITIDGTPLARAEDTTPKGWFSNLVEKIDHAELARIADDLLRAVDEDKESRRDWIEERATGMKLLGLKIELPNQTGTADGAPVEGMSRVRHPLLLEAVLRFQANARSELLPTDGPVKIRNDDNNSTEEEDRLADALERDFNHYLTSTATEYYPDTDRMLMMLGYGGSAFKKVYYCPLRNRPVSESIDAEDLIVNNTATDLQNARRITHRVYMKRSTIRRLQILGVYRDIPMSDFASHELDAVQREKSEIAGVSDESIRGEDRDREIYECYCELDIKGFEHRWKGNDTGLEIPYRVTIDVESREILSIVRNYDQDTDALPVARTNFVHYNFVPGFGFYGIGLLHILGNTTNAITAAWRELLDAGMFASFPGFLLSDAGGRQNTNIFRIPPGGSALVKTGTMPINQAVMPLPYKDPSPALMQLVGDMAQTGMRVGGTSEMQVGEGRPDAPVGTTLAMIEQAEKVMNSVHKRLHSAQAAEFTLLAQCFKENPESFWERNRKPNHPWDEQTFTKALEDYDLIPQADPNTASHGQRLMKIMGLIQLAQQSPNLYDPEAINRAALQAMGWNNPDQFLAPPQNRQAPPPQMQAEMAKLQIQKQMADAKTLDSQARMVAAQKQDAGDTNPQEMQLRMMDAQTKARQTDLEADRLKIEDQNRDQDRSADLLMQRMKLEGDMVRQHHDQRHDLHMAGVNHVLGGFADMAANTARAEPQKRGRGRPKGSGKKSSASGNASGSGGAK